MKTLVGTPDPEPTPSPMVITTASNTTSVSSSGWIRWVYSAPRRQP